MNLLNVFQVLMTLVLVPFLWLLFDEERAVKTLNLSQSEAENLLDVLQTSLWSIVALFGALQVFSQSKKQVDKKKEQAKAEIARAHVQPHKTLVFPF